MREKLLTSRYCIKALNINSDQYLRFKEAMKSYLNVYRNVCIVLKEGLNLVLSKNEALAALLGKVKRVSNRVLNGLDTQRRNLSTSYCTATFQFSLDTSPAVTCLATGVWTPLLPAPHPHNVRYVDGVRYRQISAVRNSPYSVGGSAAIGGTGYFSFNEREVNKFKRSATVYAKDISLLTELLAL